MLQAMLQAMLSAMMYGIRDAMLYAMLQAMLQARALDDRYTRISSVNRMVSPPPCFCLHRKNLAP